VPILDIPERYRPGIVLIRDMPESLFAKILVEFERSPNNPSVDSDEEKEVVAAVRGMYRYRLYAEVPVEVFVTDVLDALLEYKSIDTDDVPKLGQRLSRIFDIEDAGVEIKGSLLRLEHEHRYCAARILTDVRPIFGLDVNAPPRAMQINHILRVTYHEDEDATREIYFALQPQDLSELRELIERAEAKESSLRSALAATGVKLLDEPQPKE
jgi:hypothetical protein